MFDSTFGVIYDCMSDCKIYLMAVNKMSQSEHHSMSRCTAVPLFAMFLIAVSARHKVAQFSTFNSMLFKSILTGPANVTELCTAF